MIKPELLAPVGNEEKLNYALHFGADAVYLAGTSYGLRAYAGNFDDVGLKLAVDKVHALGKKVYVTVNIFAKNSDFGGLHDHIAYLSEIGVDAIIVSDPGLIAYAVKYFPDVEIHLSTQANTTNKHAARFWAEMGVKRIVLARELTLTEVREIRDYLPDEVELEAFVHGAMCISYSGRCLLSNYLSTRDSNRGECVQACRWEYELHEVKRPDSPLTLGEDSRGSYLFNSKDLNLIRYLDRIIDAGVCSLKIEGRMKSPYYVVTVVNAYRHALDSYLEGRFEVSDELYGELTKTAHRCYTTGFMIGDGTDTVYTENSHPTQEYDFIACVLDSNERGILVEQRNRFKVGDTLELLSTDGVRSITVEAMSTEDGEPVDDAKRVQQRLYLHTDVVARPYDILRKKSV